MVGRFMSGVGASEAVMEQPALWFAFSKNRLLVYSDGAGNAVLPKVRSLAELGLEPIRSQFLGTLNEQPCYSAELSSIAEPPEKAEFRGLRDLYDRLPEAEFALAGRAVQIMEWDRTHQFCGHCGTPTETLPNERAKRCPACGLTNYPRLSPAVIVLIHRGEEVLLARSHRFPTGMYSVLAGFVEPGESLEETVEREVFEEVGVRIKDLRYFGSQPWAFPNSLMVGFTATYASGEISIEPEEIADAAWFHRSALPEIPPKLSIARKLIDWFVSADLE